MSDRNERPGAADETFKVAPRNHDPLPELRRRLEETLLPPDLREAILAALPNLEERQRLFRELQEKGGLSSEEFLASLDGQANANP